ncbi:MAG TPA: cupin-like domain-containing protein [Blastocatellia bacterium]|nr:cupin-like domain-containing protein [Blastocatellia bacterium]
MSLNQLLESEAPCHHAHAAQASPPLLELDPAVFHREFNRKPFLVGHHLADHPSFTLPRLVELARRHPEKYVSYNAGDASVAEGLYKAPKTGLSVEETIRRIEECKSWMVIKRVEQDDEYRPLLDQCLDQIQPLSEPLYPGMRSREAFIFISSPNSVTPYHMDPEHNILLQIRGRKTIHIWDRADRSVLSERELEEFFASGESINLTYKDEYHGKASVFEMTRGLGLHFPVTSPHWVQNGDEVSISFSITFQTPWSDRRAALYTANYGLRKLGINPAPVGNYPMRDSAKFFGFRVLRKARAVGQRVVTRK